jgi:hypothetical protein
MQGVRREGKGEGEEEGEEGITATVAGSTAAERREASGMGSCSEDEEEAEVGDGGDVAGGEMEALGVEGKSNKVAMKVLEGPTMEGEEGSGRERVGC